MTNTLDIQCVIAKTIVDMEIRQSRFKSKTWMTILLLAAGVLTANTLLPTGFFKVRETQRNVVSEVSASEPTLTTVTALGRLEPQGEITRLSASSSNQRLAQVLVGEGDIVQAGQAIAVLDNIDIRKAALEEAQAKVKAAQAHLTQVSAGAKMGAINAQQSKIVMLEAQLAGDIEAQKATIARLEAEVRNAEVDYQRHQNLYDSGAISASLFDTKHTQMETLREQLREATVTLERTVNTGQAQVQAEKETLQSIAEVRSVDIAEAQAQVDEALALVSKAEADLELAYVRSPVNGQILNLHAKAGEIVGGQGFADIGQTQQMYVVAEIYETDIRHVQIGQTAAIISEYGGFTGELRGVVNQIGLQIDKPGISNDDPAAKADVRVVEVKIRLNSEDSERVRHLNNLQVRASIEI